MSSATGNWQMVRQILSYYLMHFLTLLLMLYPLVLPAITAFAGFWVGLRVRSHTSCASLRVLLAFLGGLIVAAVISNAHQTLYDLGFSFPAIDHLQTLIYGIVAFSVTCLWSVPQVWFRSLAILLAAASFTQPLLEMFMLGAWTMNGFAP